jgi:hypothetical protein
MGFYIFKAWDFRPLFEKVMSIPHGLYFLSSLIGDCAGKSKTTGIAGGLKNNRRTPPPP